MVNGGRKVQSAASEYPISRIPHSAAYWLFALVVILAGCSSLDGLPSVAPTATPIPAVSTPVPVRPAGGLLLSTATARSAQTRVPQAPQVKATSTLTAYGTPQPTPTLLPGSERQAIFEDVWQKVEDNYLYADFHGVDWYAMRSQYEPQALAASTDDQFYNLISDMVGQLNDGHSRYISPEEARQEDALATGRDEYVGVGILTQADAASLLVVQVFPGSPAEQAGIRPRDRILGVNGQPFSDANKEASRIKGPEGSAVRLTIRSPEQDPRQVTLSRHAVNARIVATGHRLGVAPGIGYLSIPSLWAQDMDQQVEEQLKTLLNGPPLTGLVIDLRSNGGGWRTVLEGILGEFVSGQVGSFYSQKGSYPLTIAKGQLYARLRNVPVVVLVDKGTQSYAELLAASLQAQGRVKVVGVTSAGNTETIYPYDMQDGSRVWVAEEGFKLPDGTTLEGRGVIPDVTVDVDWTNYPERDDPVILRAVQLLGQ